MAYTMRDSSSETMRWMDVSMSRSTGAPYIDDSRNGVVKLSERIYLSCEEITQQMLLSCDKCDKTFKNPSARRLHAVKVHAELLTGQDRKLYASKKVRHAVHIKKEFYCPIMGCKYDNRQTRLFFGEFKLLKQHYLKVHGKRDLECRVCRNRFFVLERDRFYHEKSCGGQIKREVDDRAKEKVCRMSKRLVSAPLQRDAMGLVVMAPKASNHTPVTINPVSAVKRIAPRVARSTYHPCHQPTKDMSIQTDSSSLPGAFYAPPELRPRDNQDFCAQIGDSYIEYSYQPQVAQKSQSTYFDFQPQVTHSGQDIFCQTYLPPLVDASVSTDLGAYLGNNASNQDRYTNTPGLDMLVSASNDLLDDFPGAILTTIETQTDCSGELKDLEEFLRNMETQTSFGSVNVLTDIETQTSFVGGRAAETQT